MKLLRKYLTFGINYPIEVDIPLKEIHQVCTRLDGKLLYIFEQMCQSLRLRIIFSYLFKIRKGSILEDCPKGLGEEAFLSGSA